MHVIAKKTYSDWIERSGHTDDLRHFDTWWRTCQKSRWTSFADVKAQIPSVSTVKGAPDRLVFNIKGNEYRIIVTIKYATATAEGRIWIKWVGDHREYDRIDHAKVDTP